MTGLRTLSLLIGLVVAISCALTIGRDVTILEQSAQVLRGERLEAEAARIEDLVNRIRESRLKGEGSIHLGVDPAQILSEYATKLRGMNRDAAAAKLESFAKEYREEQVKAFLRQRGPEQYRIK